MQKYSNKHLLKFQLSDERKKFLEFFPFCYLESGPRPKIEISRWVYECLCKIQAMRGVPVTLLVDYSLVKFVLENWNFEENKPRE